MTSSYRKKKFNFYHQRNENIAHNEISPHSIYNGYYKKRPNKLLTRMCTEGNGPLHTAGMAYNSLSLRENAVEVPHGVQDRSNVIHHPHPHLCKPQKMECQRDLCTPGFISALFQKSQYTDSE